MLDERKKEQKKIRNEIVQQDLLQKNECIQYQPQVFHRNSKSI